MEEQKNVEYPIEVKEEKLEEEEEEVVEETEDYLIEVKEEKVEEEIEYEEEQIEDEEEQIEDEEDTEDDEEEILVYVNFDEPIDDYSKEELVNTKIIGLDTEEPVLQIGNKVFGGSWNETVGTALFFEETTPVPKRCYFSEKVSKPMKYYGKTTKLLNLKRIFVSEKIVFDSNEEAETRETNSSDNDGNE